MKAFTIVGFDPDRAMEKALDRLSKTPPPPLTTVPRLCHEMGIPTPPEGSEAYIRLERFISEVSADMASLLKK